MITENMAAFFSGNKLTLCSTFPKPNLHAKKIFLFGDAVIAHHSLVQPNHTTVLSSWFVTEALKVVNILASSGEMDGVYLTAEYCMLVTRSLC